MCKLAGVGYEVGLTLNDCSKLGITLLDDECCVTKGDALLVGYEVANCVNLDLATHCTVDSPLCAALAHIKSICTRGKLAIPGGGSVNVEAIV